MCHRVPKWNSIVSTFSIWYLRFINLFRNVYIMTIWWWYIYIYIVCSISKCISIFILYSKLMFKQTETDEKEPEVEEVKEKGMAADVRLWHHFDRIISNIICIFDITNDTANKIDFTVITSPSTKHFHSPDFFFTSTAYGSNSINLFFNWEKYGNLVASIVDGRELIQAKFSVSICR